MQVYKQYFTITTNGGSGSTNTHSMVGGIMKQLYIIASTSTVLFRVNVTDDHSTAVRSYDFQKGELNDDIRDLVVKGPYTVQITDASADCDFSGLIMVRES